MQAPGSSSYPLPLQRLARSAAAVAAAGLLLAGTAPASLADITTVTAQQAIDQARPLPQQNVNKGRIWMLFVLGATALFGSTGALAGLMQRWRRLGGEVCIRTCMCACGSAAAQRVSALY